MLQYDPSKGPGKYFPVPFPHLHVTSLAYFTTVYSHALTQARTHTLTHAYVIYVYMRYIYMYMYNMHYTHTIYKWSQLNFEYLHSNPNSHNKKNCRAPSKNSKPSKRNTERKPVSNEEKKRALHHSFAVDRRKKNKNKIVDSLLSKPPRWV